MLTKLTGYAKIKRDAAAYIDSKIKSGKDFDINNVIIYFQTQFGLGELTLRKILEPYVATNRITITKNLVIVNPELNKQEELEQNAETQTLQ